MSTLDNLMSQLSTAAARVEVARPVKRRGRAAQTDAAVALKRRAAELEAAQTLALHNRAAREEEDNYRRRVDRLRVVGKRRAAVKHAMSVHANDCTPYGPASRLARLDAALRAASDAVFALPIIPAELGERGRFHKRAEWLGLSVGMTAADTLDIVQQAAELCYVKGQTAEDKRGRNMPTIGGMYRNLRAAFNAQVDLFRQHKRHGVVALYSLDAAFETMGAEWLDANAARIEYLGYGLHDANDYPATMVPAANAAASRATLARAERQRRFAQSMREWDVAERDALASTAALPAGVDRLDFERDRVAIRVLINGGTLADVAAATGMRESDVTAHLLTLEGSLGLTTRASGVDSTPVRSTLDHTSDAVKYRHERRGFTTSRDGTRASEVVVTRR